MWDEETKEVFFNVCKKHAYKDTENIVVPEPYLPYVPKTWNGIFVLAEAQTPSTGYWEKLKVLDSTDKMTRLGRKELQYKEGDIGIGPWNDRTIKLALQAIFEGANLKLKLEEVAVSNAVPWTRKGTGKNLNPDEQMQAKAAEFWKEIFDVWQPDIKALVVLGNVAKRVMRNAGILEKCRVLKLRLPSPNAINRVSGMFDCVDLKTRFPEVEKALHTLKIIEKEKQYKMKVFFACHAVSLGVSKFKKWYGGKNSKLTTNDNG